VSPRRLTAASVTISLATVPTADCTPFTDDGPPAPSAAVASMTVVDAAGVRGADAAPDAAATASLCDLEAPFGAPTFVPGLTIDGATAVGGLRLSPDLRTGYLYVNRPSIDPNLEDLYTTIRPSEDAPFSELTLIEGAGINTPVAELHPTVSGDGQWLVFVRGIPKGQGGLFYATRVTGSGPFVYGGALAGTTPGHTDDSPFLREDGQVLYYASAPPDGSTHIVRAERMGAGIQPPAPVPELDSSADDKYPVVTPDELTIFFGSTRTDGGAHGSEDIWTASRSSTGLPFSSLQNVSELNSPNDEWPTFVSRDGCTLYFTTDVVDETHPYGISSQYVAQRPARQL
jgi:hypothetical protein